MGVSQGNRILLTTRASSGSCQRRFPLASIFQKIWLFSKDHDSMSMVLKVRDRSAVRGI
jgi:hypothetical protein